MNLPAAVFMPAQSAADWPQLYANRCARMRASAAPISFRMSQELSELKSSVMTISYVLSDDFIASWIPATNGRRLPASLWQGMTKLTVGFSMPICRNSLRKISAVGKQIRGQRSGPHPNPLPSDGRGNSDWTFLFDRPDVRRITSLSRSKNYWTALPLPSDGRGPG